MNIDQFIWKHRVKPGDAIVVQKEFLGLLKHYVIYLGVAGGEHKFIANYHEGVKILPNHKLLGFLRTYVPVKINRFTGTDHQRHEVVQRALSRMNENAYDLIINNCEHYANWVQTGKSTSAQVDNVGGGLLALGLFGLLMLALNTNND